ncbi:Por secretion system C-terminal sorting domain-containing protein [Reichenbachiella agariperforans]|uniref:Por secretion system C-terminal sorting domain-containing protein n=1 Tax=Reichenbachiella agariperforans TaxID=156994 RepID=A0A1M6SXM5_REIAG|nr:T9SS type A sorting domain-containing protein [Reichenbachiella agariperforans]SHK49419.1 Por secretion system C-terminal sorting domain-containing protein [Reichenbachiella agariperforans]
MKTTLKTIALTLLVTMTSLAYAGEKSEKMVSPELNVQITAMSQSKVLVAFNKLEGEVVKVKIYDAAGSLIYQDKDVNNAKYAKRFDLSAYPAGEYVYAVSNDVYSVSKTVELK